MRKVILHYHIFKNAGKSIDSLLLNSLGNRLAKWDKDQADAIITNDEVVDFVSVNTTLAAISSHQFVSPIPTSDLVKFFPIVFIRHPIERAFSAYFGRLNLMDSKSQVKL